jgi:2-polyprenyl-3-methyl-5-hydroxy-6-metoxy-1,4-benzoquinol methylase
MPYNATMDLSQRVAPRELPELMDSACSYEEFLGCLRSLEEVNRWLMGYRPTLAWLDRKPRGSVEPVHIVDVGSGGGGLLRQIRDWAWRRGISVQLTGIDLNPYAARAAAELSGEHCEIEWLTGDALEYQPSKPADIILCSLMTHHLEDQEIIALLRWMEGSALAGWFINDLERSEWACRMFGVVARMMGWHRFVRHDGPVSFRRAFRHEDWTHLIAVADVSQNTVAIERWWPGRLSVGRWK